MPSVSAIVPVERGHHNLVAALDGFLAQSIALRDLEIVIVSPTPRAPIPRSAKQRKLMVRRVAWPRGRGLASAINAGAKAARGRVVVVVKPGWRPLPELARYCLSFHDRHEALADVAVLTPVLSAADACDPLLWWLDQQQLAGLTPLPAGIHSWRALRFDALCAKRRLLVKHPLPHGEGDEWLMRNQWVRSAPLRVMSEPVAVLATAGAPPLEDWLRDEYQSAAARLRAMRASSETFGLEAVDDRFQRPEKYILSDADRDELRMTIGDLEAQLQDRDPRFAIGDDAERFALLGKLYLTAISDARSRGWSEARKASAIR